MDVQRRFGGIARLYGPAALEKFLQARVCVIGLGGVGAWTAEALARSGIGRLRLIDPDHLAESNINRQLPALDATLGAAKVQVLAERFAGIHPRLVVEPVEEFLTPDNLDELLAGYFDFVIDCADEHRTKAALVHHCRRRRLPLVVVGGAGGRQDPLRVRMSDLSRTEQDPLLARTRRLLRQRYGFSRNPKRRFGVPAIWSDEPAVRHPLPGDSCEGPGGHLNCGGLGSCTPVTAAFGMAAAGVALRRLAAEGGGRL